MWKKLVFGLLILTLIAVPYFAVACEEEPSGEEGGDLRMIGRQFPSNLGDPTQMSMGQVASLRYFAEWLVTWDEDGNPVGELAESWEEDPANKTLTWHVRKGVKFHDGTTLDAEAVKWNFEIRMDAGRLNEGERVDSIEVVGEYTVVMHLNEYTATQVKSYGLCVMFSPTAIETNGLEWALTHPVSTGPFKVTEVQRDTVIEMEKFDDYWRGDPYPYIDTAEIRFIPDATTAVAMMEAGEADQWDGVTGTDIRMALDLEEKGLNITWGSGIIFAIMPWSEDGIFADKMVRQAIWCALDLQALADLLGYGTFEPFDQIAVSSDMGYNEGYAPYSYDVERAKQLLSDAGHPDGFETKLLCTQDMTDLALAVQNYLAAVDIIVEVDIADQARYMSETSADGWDGLMLSRMGYMQDMYLWWDYWGTSSGRKYRIGIAQSAEFLDLLAAARLEADWATRKDLMQQVVRQATEDCMYIPLYTTPMAYITQSWLHREPVMIHNMVYYPHEWWIEEH